ncbi:MULTISPECIES: DUF5707 domain-containing protein [unclassified Streptomyces]|uniref:DUF5707 domain-containing protein n=1 Tax=unclassified Streptomyces TaxID=2593676 RepID=UPI0009391198|nr:DUF5707 domain-containing protein [Streptomyces sp. CB02400]OKK08806.1 hypothetical protein AMK33_17920 [Streptomyces sp. CB02400]
MSKRVLVPSVIGLVTLGALGAGGYAMASTVTEPTVENGSAGYVAPSQKSEGKLSFAADVSDDSGVREVRVVAWPASSELDPTEAELRYVDKAECRGTSDGTSRCTYTLKVTQRDAADLAEGTWYVSVLATAKDGGTTFVPRAATFDVTR